MAQTSYKQHMAFLRAGSVVEKDPTKTATQWLKSAEKVFAEGDLYMAKRNYDNAYRLYMRGVSIVMEMVPRCRDFIKDTNYEELKRKAIRCMDELELMMDRFKEHHPDTLPPETAVQPKIVSGSSINRISASDDPSQPRASSLSLNTRLAALIPSQNGIILSPNSYVDDSSLPLNRSGYPPISSRVGEHRVVRSSGELMMQSLIKPTSINIAQSMSSYSNKGMAIPPNTTSPSKAPSYYMPSSYSDSPPLYMGASRQSNNVTERKPLAQISRSNQINDFGSDFLPHDRNSVLVNAPYPQLRYNNPPPLKPLTQQVYSTIPGTVLNGPPTLPHKPDALKCTTPYHSSQLPPISTSHRVITSNTSGLVNNAVHSVSRYKGMSPLIESRYHPSDSAYSEVAMSSVHGVVGLKNMGNTCYMNSILQCLNGATPLTRFFHSGAFRKFINSDNPLGTKGKLAYTYAELVRIMSSAQAEAYITPVQFRDSIAAFAPQFASSDQQDSHEFLSFLLDGLHEDLKARPQGGVPDNNDDLEGIDPRIAADMAWERYCRRNWSRFVELFQGQLRSTLRCTVCGTVSTTYNPFMYLSLPIPRQSGVSLLQCINNFLCEEILDGDNAWNCSSCKQPRRSTKSFSLTHMPDILVMHLKRFSFTGPFRDKLDTFVNFPMESLDLNAYLGCDAQGPYRYDLYGVVNHFGGLDGGHYTSVVKHNVLKKWHYFDDTRVSVTTDPDKIVSKAAYNLFYVRKGITR